jgi:hypothetical protein
MADDIPNQPKFAPLALKTIAVHTITYFIVGAVAAALLNYEARFAEPILRAYMRQFDSPWLLFGPLLQPIRGVLFAVVFFLLREAFFGKKNGWLLMWAMLAILGIFTTFGPTPGSVEGVLYTQLPLATHLWGLPEVLLQSLLFALILTYWVNHPEKRWLSWLLWILFFICIALPLLGLFVGTETTVTPPAT